MSRDLGHNGHLEDLVAGYIDRLLAGETLDFDEVVAEHPDTGEEIVKHLESYVGIGSDRVEEEPLGTLGDYTLRQQIGRGGMGMVYEAWEGSMDRVVALKVLPAGIAADDRSFQRFMQEAKTAGKLNHQNIVPVYSTGIKEGTPWFSMEYVEGETLAQVLARIKDAEPEAETPFGPKDQGDYFIRLGRAFADVADGLQHAHSKGVTHRDIKPSNLILDGDGRLRILDFGLARLEGQESLTLSGDFVGTPLYMSPEQARRKKIPIDHRTDVYSLGATMYEAICGRPPLRGKDHADTLSQIIERDPTEPRKVNPRVPRDLETVVLKCLRKDPEDRYGTAEALEQDLRRFVRGDPIEARPQPAWEQILRRASRHTGKLLVMAASLTLAIICVVLAGKYYAEKEKTQVRDYESAVVRAATKLLRGQMVLSGSARKSPSNTLLLPKRYKTLLGASAKNATEEAVRELAAAVATRTERFEGHYYLARGLWLLGREEESARELERALARSPDFVPARLLVAELRGGRNANTALGANTGGDSGDDWGKPWERAYRAVRGRNWEEATSALSELIETEDRRGRELYLGSRIENRIRRGVASLKTGDFEKAKLDFEDARVLSRTHWGTHWGEFLEPALLLGMTYFLEGKHSRAQEFFEEMVERAARRDPMSRDETSLWVAGVYSSLHDSLAASARLPEAIQAGRRVVSLRPRDVEAHVILGWSLLRVLWLNGEGGGLNRGDARSAEFLELAELCERASDLAPEDTAVNVLYRKMLATQGDLVRARESSPNAFSSLIDGPSQRRSDVMSTQSIKSTALAGALLAFATAGNAESDSFGEPEVVVSSPFVEWGPCLSSDGNSLYYSIFRHLPGDLTEMSLAVATLNEETGEFRFDRQLDELNIRDMNGSPWLSRDGERIYFSSKDDVAGGPAVAGWKLYTATRDEDGRFRDVKPLEEINRQFFHAFAPSLTPDELEIYFTIFSSSFGQHFHRDLAMATREHRDDPFGEVRLLDEINTAVYDETNPSISSDGKTLFWSGLYENPPGGPGESDMWWATREERFVEGDGTRRPVEFKGKERLPSPPNSTGIDADVFVTADWPAHDSAIYFLRCWETPEDCDVYRSFWQVALAFHRGDCNDDGAVDISDAIFTLGSLFFGQGDPNCDDACDANDDGAVDISDAISTLGVLFLGNGIIPLPGMTECGVDLTDDQMGCDAFRGCP